MIFVERRLTFARAKCEDINRAHLLELLYDDENLPVADKMIRALFYKNAAYKNVSSHFTWSQTDTYDGQGWRFENFSTLVQKVVP